MRWRVVTLRFDPQQNGFDDMPLTQLGATTDLLGVHELLLVHEGQPYLVCLAALDGSAVPPVPQPEARPRAAARRREEDPRAGLSEEDARRFDAVRAWRTERAREQGLPPYALLTNRQVLAILAAAPADLEALARVPGIGEGWTRLHGHDVLERLAAPAPAPAVATAPVRADPA